MAKIILLLQFMKSCVVVVYTRVGTFNNDNYLFTTDTK